MMLQRELCELKIEELIKENDKLIDEYETGKCSKVYFIKNSFKICGEILGISFALGQDVESEIGKEE